MQGLSRFSHRLPFFTPSKHIGIGNETPLKGSPFETPAKYSQASYVSGDDDESDNASDHSPLNKPMMSSMKTPPLLGVEGSEEQTSHCVLAKPIADSSSTARKTEEVVDITKSSTKEQQVERLTFKTPIKVPPQHPSFKTPNKRIQTPSKCSPFLTPAKSYTPQGQPNSATPDRPSLVDFRTSSFFTPCKGTGAETPVKGSPFETPAKYSQSSFVSGDNDASNDASSKCDEASPRRFLLEEAVSPRERTPSPIPGLIPEDSLDTPPPVNRSEYRGDKVSPDTHPPKTPVKAPQLIIQDTQQRTPTKRTPKKTPEAKAVSAYINDNPGVLQTWKRLNEVAEKLLEEQGKGTNFVFISPSKRRPKRAILTQIAKPVQQAPFNHFLSEWERQHDVNNLDNYSKRKVRKEAARNDLESENNSGQVTESSSSASSSSGTIEQQSREKVTSPLKTSDKNITEVEQSPRRSQRLKTTKPTKSPSKSSAKNNTEPPIQTPPQPPSKTPSRSPSKTPKKAATPARNSAQTPAGSNKRRLPVTPAKTRLNLDVNRELVPQLTPTKKRRLASPQKTGPNLLPSALGLIPIQQQSSLKSKEDILKDDNGEKRGKDLLTVALKGQVAPCTKVVGKAKRKKWTRLTVKGPLRVYANQEPLRDLMVVENVGETLTSKAYDTIKMKKPKELPNMFNIK